VFLLAQNWDPDTPYLKEIKKGKTDMERYEIYLKQRKNYINSPAFYFDVAHYFFANKNRHLGVRYTATFYNIMHTILSH
jgi:hypothetical protein